MRKRLPLLVVFLCLLSPSALAQDGTERLAVERDLAAEGVRYGPHHPRIRALNARLEALPAPSSSPELCRSLTAERARLVAQRAELATRLGPRHERMRAMEARLGKAAEQLTRLCHPGGSPGGTPGRSPERAPTDRAPTDRAPTDRAPTDRAPTD